MKHRYTAKLYFEDGQVVENVGDDIEQLTRWMSDQAEASYQNIKGEIFDHHTHRIIKSIQYSSQ